MRFGILIIVCSISQAFVETLPQIQTSNGLLNGRSLKTLLLEKDYFAFEGIPYAEPPVRELRFEAPLLKSNWNGVYQANKIQNPCAQFNHNLKRAKAGVYGSEDCLYLDIYTPSVKEHNPVIVFLQNQNFIGTNNKTKDYKPDFFVEEDVLVVTISHRLGVFGFLSLENDKLPGNVGLKDIILALQWIKANIEHFGGDPSRITLMGSLGGGIAIDILLHSKRARGLFTSAVLQSGTAWESIVFNQHARDDAYRLAERLDIAAISDSDLIKQLKKVDTFKLLGHEFHVAHQDYTKIHQTGIMSFGPYTEPDHPDAVITVLPEKDFDFKLDIPVMIGFNSEEGLEASEMYMHEPRYLSYVERDLLLLIPLRGLRFKTTNSNAYAHAVDKVKQYYFDGKVKISQPTEYLKYIGDIIIHYPVDYTVRKYVKTAEAPIYYYQFDYDGKFNENKLNLLNHFTVWNETWGAASGDELCYLFLCPKFNEQYKKASQQNTQDFIFLKKMIKLWTNFAKYGNPTPSLKDDALDGVEWNPVSDVNHQYLHIAGDLSMQTNPNKERFKFWDDFMEMYSKIAVNGVVEHVKDEL